MLLLVLLGLLSVPGVVGGVVSPPPDEPSHAPPLILQLLGVTPPGAPIQPKLVLPPAASVAFQVPVAATWVPVTAKLASQKEEMVEPLGRSNSTFQVTEPAVPLVI